jgi:hypothetical protein
MPQSAIATGTGGGASKSTKNNSGAQAVAGLCVYRKLTQIRPIISLTFVTHFRSSLRSSSSPCSIFSKASTGDEVCFLHFVVVLQSSN